MSVNFTVRSLHVTFQRVLLHQWGNSHYSPAPSADSHRFYNPPSLQTEIGMDWIPPAKREIGWNCINEKQMMLKHGNLLCALDVILLTS